jgi:hypothetical protein
MLGLAVAVALGLLGLPIFLAGVTLQWGSRAVGYWAAFVFLGTIAVSVLIVVPATLGCCIILADGKASGRLR